MKIQFFEERIEFETYLVKWSSPIWTLSIERLMAHSNMMLYIFQPSWNLRRARFRPQRGKQKKMMISLEKSPVKYVHPDLSRRSEADTFEESKNVEIQCRFMSKLSPLDTFSDLDFWQHTKVEEGFVDGRNLLESC